MPHTTKMSKENLSECENVKGLFAKEKARTKMTHRMLGAMIGKSEQTISAIINGRMKVTIGVARELARVFAVPVSQILPWVSDLETSSDYDSIIQDIEELNTENRRHAARMIQSLLDSQEDL